jgi:thioredoxin reductase
MELHAHDIAIVGGGPAGLSAALVLGRARRRVVVIDAGTPRGAAALHLQGFLSRDGIPPSELLRIARAQVERYGVQVIEDRVVDARAGFELRLAGGRTIHVRHVLIATGAADELPDIPGAQERWGRDVLHCAHCHGWEIRNQPLGVLATGAGCVEHAHLLRQWSDDVTLFTDRHPIADEQRATLDARGIGVVDGLVERLVIADDRHLHAVRLSVDGRIERLVVADDRLHAVRLADGRTFACAALFVCPAPRADVDGLGAALGCELRAGGLLRADADGRTSVPGVWAAGDVTGPRAQAITAAGDGAAVAVAVNAELVSRAVAAAVR